MIEALKFAARAVSRNDRVPGLQHFRIQAGRVTAFNGVLALSAPIAVSFDAAPLALPFLRALDACKSLVSITQESASKLIVRSGPFKAAVPCVSVKDVPAIRPEGIDVVAPAELLTTLAMLKPFICTDEQRRELCGILFAGESAYATNNVVLVERWLGTAFPYRLNVPDVLVDEALRIEEPPLRLQMTDSSVTLHYADGSWMRSQTNPTPWPDVAGVLDRTWDARRVEIPRDLRDACRTLAAFAGKDRRTTFFRGVDVATTFEDTLDTALVDVSAPDCGAYNTKYLSDVLSVADKIDFSAYPNAVSFSGDKLRGALCGTRI